MRIKRCGLWWVGGVGDAFAVAFCCSHSICESSSAVYGKLLVLLTLLLLLFVCSYSICESSGAVYGKLLLMLLLLLFVCSRSSTSQAVRSMVSCWCWCLCWFFLFVFTVYASQAGAVNVAVELLKGASKTFWRIPTVSTVGRVVMIVVFAVVSSCMFDLCCCSTTPYVRLLR